jgi:diaminopimelate decarboxylase
VRPFAYHHGRLACEAVPLDTIAAEAGSPVYVYSAGAMRARLAAFQAAFAGLSALFCFAVKANSHIAVIRTLAAAGAGADTVSGGEIERALAAGVPPAKIVFAGIAKTDEEIRMALDLGIMQLNVESVPELLRISALAAERGATAPVALRINPDVDAGTHDKISTGRKEDKFGIPYADAGTLYGMAASLPGIAPVGLHLHIGSQITTLEPFAQAYRRGVDLFKDIRRSGIPLRRLDLGGGFGVRYKNEEPVPPAVLAALVRELVQGLDVELVLEPGRALVAEAGALLATVIYRKDSGGRRFLVLDAGMNVLIRPALYGAYHEVLPLAEPAPGAHLERMDVVGPICESSDIFGRDRYLPLLDSGDRVAILSAGAYGAVMASPYNSRWGAAEVLVDGGRWAVIRPRRAPAAQFADEVIPAWLEPGCGSAGGT